MEGGSAAVLAARSGPLDATTDAHSSAGTSSISGHQCPASKKTGVNAGLPALRAWEVPRGEPSFEAFFGRTTGTPRGTRALLVPRFAFRELCTLRIDVPPRHRWPHCNLSSPVASHCRTSTRPRTRDDVAWSESGAGAERNAGMGTPPRPARRNLLSPHRCRCLGTSASYAAAGSSQ